MAEHGFPRRELYAPGHFGNWYEAAGRFEMRDILAEAKWWGFNWYGDWFDTVNLTKEHHMSPVVSRCWLTKVLWENKKIRFQEAIRLGFKLNLLVTPNHVYADQVSKEIQAKDLSAKEAERRKIRFFGHLVCPSIPKARRIILENYEELFRDLAENNIRLDAVTYAAYDFGGCACRKCYPWIVTFAELCREIQGIAAEYFPGVAMRFCCWWWDSKDHDLFADWVDKHMPGEVESLALWIKYNEDRPASVPPGRLPEECGEEYFIHIGYSDDRSDNDVYGQWGPVVAPSRIPRTLATLRDSCGKGFMAYSEGVFDDVNKAILGGLSSGRFSTVREVLEEYARRYFEAEGRSVEEWVEWILQWGRPRMVDLARARRVFNRLVSKAPETWRLAHFASKLRLFELNKQLEGKKAGTRKRLAMVEEFLREREALRRKIYGLHPLEESVFKAIVGEPRWHRKLIAATTSSNKAPLRKLA
ncbi:MAG: hypothetical protein QXO76_02110 [Thermoproteota archaeon]